MVSVLASDNLGEVEVGSAHCAGSHCFKTFRGLLMDLTHDFLICFLDIKRVWTVQVCITF